MQASLCQSALWAPLHSPVQRLGGRVVWTVECPDAALVIPEGVGAAMRSREG